MLYKLKYKVTQITVLLIAFVPILGIGQISVINSSFEGEREDATIPQGWLSCKEGTTPDICPGPWGVYNDPSDGESYIGLITRRDGTWESLGQRLSYVMKKGDCYQFSIDLARSDTYAGYSAPLKLRIWFGRKLGEREQLAFESPRIEHLEWKKYQVELTPEKDFRYIIIEAHHKDGRFSYDGNILVDNLSVVSLCEKS